MPYPLYPLPDLNDEQDSLLRRLGHAAFTPLQWLGETLDKPGAAIRGLLARQPTQLLNLLPFSDSLGVTDPSQRVSGRDVLRAWLPESVIAKENTWGNALPGFALEVLTDPLNLLSFGPLTKVGKEVAKVTQNVPRTAQFTEAGLRGLPEVMQAAVRTGNAIDPEARELLKTVGKRPFVAPDLPGLVPEFAVEGGQIAKQTPTALKKTLGIEQPFFMPESVFGEIIPSHQFDISDIPHVGPSLSQGMQDMGSVLSAAAQVLPESVRTAPKRALTAIKGLFSADAGGYANAEMQDLFKQVRQPAYRKLQAGSEAALINAHQLAEPELKAANLAGGLAAEKEMLGVVRGDVENVGEWNLRQAASEMPPPPEPMPPYMRPPEPPHAPLIPEPMPPLFEDVDLIPHLDLPNSQIRDLAQQARQDAEEMIGQFGAPQVTPSVEEIARQAKKTGYAPLPTDEEIVQQLLRDLKPQVTGIAEQKAAEKAARDARVEAMSRKVAQEGPAYAKGEADLLDDYVRQLDEQPMIHGEAPPVVPPSPPEWTPLFPPGGRVPPPAERHPSALALEAGYAKKLQQAKYWGHDINELEGYISRGREDLGYKKLPGEGYQDFVARESKGRKLGMKIAREDYLKNIPGETGTLQKWSADPDLSGPFRRLPAEQVEERIFQQMKAGWDERSTLNRRLPENHPKRMEIPNDGALRQQAAEVASWLETMDPARSELGVGYFNLDPFTKTQRYNKSLDAAIADAQMVVQGAAQEAKPLAEWMSGTMTNPVTGKLQPVTKDNLRSVREVLDNAGLKGEGSKARLAEALGVPLEKVDDLYLPKGMADMLERRPSPWQTPEALAPVLRNIDEFSRWFKNSVTLPFPAFFSRNVMSGLYNQWRDDGFSMKSIKKAWNLVNGKGDEELLNLGKEAAAHGVALRNTGFTQELTPDIGLTSGGRAAQPPLNLEGTIPQTLKDFAAAYGKPSTLFEKGRAFNSKLEDVMRLSHYIEKKAQGFAPEVAAARVKAYHVDYTALSDFEKNVVRRLVPFYSYARGATPVLLEELMSQPAKLATSIRAANSGREDGWLPPFVGSGTALPLPGGSDGKQRFLASLGLPFEDEGLQVAASALSGNIPKALQQLLGQTNPAVKLPMEMAFGKQLFTGKDLDEIRPNRIASLGGLLPNDVARTLTQVAANSPAARAFSMADKVVNPNEGLLPMGVNLLTGLRMVEADPQAALESQAAQMIAKQLKGEGKAREFSRAYLTPGTQLSPDEQELWDLYQELGRRRKQKADLRSAAF